MLERLDSSLFTFTLWRAGSLADLGVATRRHDIVAFRNRVRAHAVGYADGTEVPCRPKEGTFAVMVQADELVFWTHFFKEEFDLVFGATDGDSQQVHHWGVAKSASRLALTQETGGSSPPAPTTVP